MASVGEQLRAARVARNLTLTDIAARTKISAPVIARIEADDERHVPGGIFVRGYLRAIAGAVGLDPEAIVTRYVASHAPPAAEEDPLGALKVTHAEAAARRSAAIRRSVATIACWLVIGIIWSALYRSPSEPDGHDVSDAVPAATTDGSPDVAVVEPDDDAAAVVRAVAREPRLSVDIETTRPVWMDLTADGRLVARRLFAPGERLHVDAANSIQWLIGDAAAVSYSVNGMKASTPGTAGKVRRLTITPDEFPAPPPDSPERDQRDHVSAELSAITRGTSSRSIAG
jgi:transcriptional regulator with XRE-family HTH domain